MDNCHSFIIYADQFAQTYTQPRSRRQARAPKTKPPDDSKRPRRSPTPLPAPPTTSTNSVATLGRFHILVARPSTSRAAFRCWRGEVRQVAHAVHVRASGVGIGETRTDERFRLLRDQRLRRELHSVRVYDYLLPKNFFLRVVDVGAHTMGDRGER